MSPVRTVRLAAAREMTERLRSKLFVLGTLVMVLVVVGGIVAVGLVGGDGPQRFDLGLAGPVPEGFGEALAANAVAVGVEIVPTDLEGRDAAVAAVTDGDVDAALLDASRLMVDGAPPIALHTAVENALHQVQIAAELEGAGLSDEQLAAAMAPRQHLTVVDAAGEEDEGLFLGEIVGFAATLLLFMAVTLNATSLLTGAVEEKSNRVVELLLGSVRPWQLLAAKIIALTALSLGQVGVIIGAALGANAFAGTFELPPATTATVVIALVMLVIGFVFYAALYTVAGSLTSTTEDAQGASAPLTFLVIVTYFLVIFAVLPSPQGFWAQVLTYLPPTAPFTVPARVAAEAIPLWQVVLASGVTLLGVVLTVALAARLYAASLLAGGKLTWREAWAAEPIS